MVNSTDNAGEIGIRLGGGGWLVELHLGHAVMYEKYVLKLKIYQIAFLLFMLDKDKKRLFHIYIVRIK